MDGEKNGKAYVEIDDLGVPLFLETPIYVYILYIRICVKKNDVTQHHWSTFFIAKVRPPCLKWRVLDALADELTCFDIMSTI